MLNNNPMSKLSCEELISVFNKVGGILECVHDTRTCTLLPQNITAIFTPENKTDIGSLLSEYAYSGHFDKYVTFLPESTKSKESRFVPENLYDYQEKNTGGFVIKFMFDKDGYKMSTVPSK